MTSKDKRSEQAAPSTPDERPRSAQALRQRAEEIARDKTGQSPENLKAMSPEEMRQTLHELRVHQIELEMQNEELRRAQVELGAARARYFDLYDLAPVSYCTLSEQGLIVEANLTAASLLGVARGALVKRPISRFILEEDQDIYYLHYKQLFETGEPQACELRMVKEDGTQFWAHLQATAAQNAGGAPVFRVVLSDITERKLAEEQLKAFSQDLERSNKELEQFAYVASHDLQEPLRMVASYVQLLARRYRGKLDADADEFIGFAVDGASRMQDMINDLLALSRLGTRGKPFAPTPLEDVLSEVLDNLKVAVAESGAVITHDPLPTVMGDSVQLGQLFPEPHRQRHQVPGR